MMQDHNILLAEATNHILNSKNSVENLQTLLYDKVSFEPGPPYDSAKVDKNSKPGIKNANFLILIINKYTILIINNYKILIIK